MKTIICLCALLAVAACHPQKAAPAPAPAPAAASPAAAVPQAATAPGAAPVAPIGNLKLLNNPQFYGAGISATAIPVNPLVLNSVNNVLRTNQNLLARVDQSGQIEFTTQFGEEVEVLDHLGRNPLEINESIFENELFNIELERQLAIERTKIITRLLAMPQFQGRFFVQ